MDTPAPSATTQTQSAQDPGASTKAAIPSSTTSTTSTTPDAALALIESYRGRLIDYEARLQQKINDTRMVFESTRVAIETQEVVRDPVEAFNYERQNDDTVLLAALRAWLRAADDIDATKKQTAEASASSIPLMVHRYSLGSPLQSVGFEELTSLLLHDRNKIEFLLSARRAAYQQAKNERKELKALQDAHDAAYEETKREYQKQDVLHAKLFDEYISKRAAWLEAIEAVRPSYLAYHETQYHLGRRQQKLGKHTTKLQSHRVYMANVMADLNYHQTNLRSRGSSNPHDDPLQLQVLAEVWQLTSATDTYLAMDKRMKSTADSIGRLKNKAEATQKSVDHLRALLETRVFQLQDVRNRMKEAGMKVPTNKEEVDLMNESISQPDWKLKPPPEEKKKDKKGKRPLKDGLGKATAELVEELRAATAAAPGTESLYLFLEGQRGRGG